MQFGGIVRHVLPATRLKVQIVLSQQERTIDEAIRDDQATHILDFTSIEDGQVSHYIAQYQVTMDKTRKNYQFPYPTLNITSKYVLDRLQNSLLNVSIENKIKTLIKNDESNYMDQVCPVLYEKLHSELMISEIGLKYQQQELSLLKQGTKPENGQVYKANKDC